MDMKGYRVKLIEKKYYNGLGGLSICCVSFVLAMFPFAIVFTVRLLITAAFTRGTFYEARHDGYYADQIVKKTHSVSLGNCLQKCEINWFCFGVIYQDGVCLLRRNILDSEKSNDDKQIAIIYTRVIIFSC